MSSADETQADYGCPQVLHRSPQGQCYCKYGNAVKRATTSRSAVDATRMRLADLRMLTCCAGYSQRLLQVGNQVVRILDSYRQPYQLLSDPHFLPLFR